jgi:hypothetical protein
MQVPGRSVIKEPLPDDQTVVVVRLTEDVPETFVPVPITPRTFAYPEAVCSA